MERYYLFRLNSVKIDINSRYFGKLREGLKIGTVPKYTITNEISTYPIDPIPAKKFIQGLQIF